MVRVPGDVERPKSGGSGCDCLETVPQLARNQPRSTMLTVRAKKSDVDSFAKDKMNLEDFRKKAKVVSYFSAIESPSGISSFGGGGSGGGGYGTSSRF